MSKVYRVGDHRLKLAGVFLSHQVYGVTDLAKRELLNLPGTSAVLTVDGDQNATSVVTSPIPWWGATFNV